MIQIKYIRVLLSHIHRILVSCSISPNLQLGTSANNTNYTNYDILTIMSIASYYVIFSFVFSNACVFLDVHLEIVSDRFTVFPPFLFNIVNNRKNCLYRQVSIGNTCTVANFSELNVTNFNVIYMLLYIYYQVPPIIKVKHPFLPFSAYKTKLVKVSFVSFFDCCVASSSLPLSRKVFLILRFMNYLAINRN